MVHYSRKALSRAIREPSNIIIRVFNLSLGAQRSSLPASNIISELSRGISSKIPTMKKTLALFLFFLLLFPQTGFSHCQIPCGIYDDEMVFRQMLQDVQTIEKSMNEINRLSESPDANMNQIVRWVNNKEAHADKIMRVAADYFLAQRVKVPEEYQTGKQDGYAQELKLLHQIILTAMKTKQTTDLAKAGELETLILKYETVYNAKKQN